jgi:translation initiation factor IF-3
MANERNQENKILSNKQIRAREVRLVNDDGSTAIVPFFKALRIAEEQNLDLILVNSVPNPPVCKIGDVGKYKYEAKKKQKELDKKNRATRVDIKEVQLRPAIDDHDLNIKISKIKEWINDGDKVKIVVRFRGREMTNTELGVRLVDHILNEVPGSKIEGKNEMQGNRLTVVLCQTK